jgi:hypothetical protein
VVLRWAGKRIVDKEQSPNAEWQFGLIAESAKNLRQIYFVYLGFISYGALTVLSIL